MKYADISMNHRVNELVAGKSHKIIIMVVFGELCEGVIRLCSLLVLQKISTFDNISPIELVLICPKSEVIGFYQDKLDELMP